MAGQNRGASPDLKLDLKLSLLKEGPSFSFFQTLRLLRHYVSVPREPGNIDGSALDGISVIPNLSLTFPAADIEKIEETGDEQSSRFRVTANFFGLYGVSSPLPTFYTEALMDERADDESASRDFINLINHRLYQLLFRSWLKHRQFQLVVEERDAAHRERLFSVLGLGEKVFRDDIEDPVSLLRYIGLFSQSPRSALGLKT
jgi:type VI secretion system protein ImpH